MSYYYGDNFMVEYPVGSGKRQTLRKLLPIFREGSRTSSLEKTAAGPSTGTPPHFRTILCGAISSSFTNTSTPKRALDWERAIKTGWTALVAKLNRTEREPEAA